MLRVFVLHSSAPSGSTIAMLVSMPVSIGAAIYLEEYAKPTRTTKLIQALVTNLAGVPSIVFGMFGLAIFVKQGGIGLGLARPFWPPDSPWA